MHANGLRAPAPTLGQHTREVMIDLLGFSAEETDALEAAGAIGTGVSTGSV